MKEKLDVVFKIFIMVISLCFLILYSQSYQSGRYQGSRGEVLDTVTGTIYYLKRSDYGGYGRQQYIKEEIVSGAKER
jgi:hypothetical protein